MEFWMVVIGKGKTPHDFSIFSDREAAESYIECLRLVNIVGVLYHAIGMEV